MKVSDVSEINARNLTNDIDYKVFQYLDTSNLTKNVLYELQLYDNKENLPSRAKRLAFKDDILISTVRPIQCHYGYLEDNIDNLVVSTGYAVITPNTDLINSKYLYYLLTKSSATNYFQRIAEGSVSAYPSITSDIIANYEIEVPDLTIQNDIVQRIAVYDSKLDINLKLISSLEEYAQLLFHKWFIDFNFPDENGNPYKDSGGEMEVVEGRMIPKGWIAKPLIEIAEFINGLAMQSYPPQGEQDKLPVIKIKEINNGGFHKDTEYVTKSVDQKLIIENGDILFPWSGSLCVKIWSGGTGCLNQHIFKVESKEYKRWFLYQWIKRHMPYFEQIAYGKKTTMGHINRRHLSLVSAYIPKPETLSKMDLIMDTLYNKIFLISQENQLLKETRDLLIKKLIK